MNNLQKLAKKKSKEKSKKELLDKLKGAFHEAAEEGDKVLKKTDDKNSDEKAAKDEKDEKDKEAKATFSPAMDKSPALKGKQSKLPDQIQAKILAKKSKKAAPLDKEASWGKAAIESGKALAKGGDKLIRRLGRGSAKTLRKVDKNKKLVKGDLRGKNVQRAYGAGTALVGAAGAKKLLSDD